MINTWILFLAAVNSGSRNRLSMQALAGELEIAGFRNVQTYLQSGNAIIDTDESVESCVVSRSCDVLAGKFGLTVPIIVRSPKELRNAIDSNPFPAEALADPGLTRIYFLPSKPPPDRLKALAAKDFAPDRWALADRDLYVSYGQNAHKSRLTQTALARYLAMSGTARSWRTITAVDSIARLHHA